MDFLKALFEAGALTWEQFENAVKEKGYKLADLATGNYVSKKKYDDDLASKDTAITGLQEQLTKRDSDISDFKIQLAEAGTSKTKIEELTNQISTMQNEYANAKNDYEAKLNKQAYEFAVKEFAGTKKFSSKAAQKQFVQEMIDANLQMKNNMILGAEDFVTAYAQDNSDSFVVEQSEVLNTPQVQEPNPIFVQPTAPQPGTTDANAFDAAFSFSGIRAKE